MANRIDPKEQFSKKLAGRTEWFWFIFMVLLVVAIIITPDSALPAVYLGIMVTGVMIISVLAYTKNSIDEKWFFWAAEIAKALNGKKDKKSTTDEKQEEDPEGGNG